ncbi:MAG: ATP-binding cassette domain-containing protein [Parabacteroides sp.]|nr:ATP-binding cassette domain-containing protein [Parabacteroides sp.]
MEDRKKLVEVKHLKKYFTISQSGKLFGNNKAILKAVDDVSFDIYEGETLGLVGESGCGKTTLGRTIMRIYDPTGGEVLFEGDDISKISQKELAPYRKDMHMIFQDPYASLNPRMTVSEIIMESMINDTELPAKERRERVLELLDLVGLNSDHASRFPHEFSGGQRQRVGIARSLAANPKFIVCDEPISALDVSIQAQVVNLLKELQHKFGLTYLFIAHDLSMVQYISDRVGVMYLGKMVELADSDQLYANPLHPYTEALMSAIPVPDPNLEETKKRLIVEGEVPSPINPPSGCAFHTRCPKASERCRKEVPQFKEVIPNHFVACHLYEK